ncbi:hypothetical protein N665_0047s0025 [Sinapis alba]|nr:hypothetical protein N665_0047s0025 [Sinapis alba]
MAIYTYAISHLRLTKHHCQKIMDVMASIWWVECRDKKTIHWISWKKLCISKENVGLSFRDTEAFNQSILVKQAWILLNEPEILISWIYKGRYFASQSFLKCGKVF